MRIVSPTQIVMDRLAAFVHWGDRQSFDQAVLVASSAGTDWEVLGEWAEREGVDSTLIGRLKEKASARA